PHSPARTVSVRSWLAALLGNSFSFLPLRFRQPLTEASSNARSRERFQDAGPAWPSPLEFPSRAFPPAPTWCPGPGIMATYVDILKTEFPEIDTELFDYITGVLDSGGADFEDGEEVYDAIGGVLQEVSADSKNEDDIRDICLQMFNTLKLNNHHHPQKQVMLEAPVQLSQMSADSVSAAKDFQGIWMMKRPQNTVSLFKNLTSDLKTHQI
ncbi:hypothetical protein XENOCAPTIV_007686, partial [Xenoophorus captivus]